MAITIDAVIIVVVAHRKYSDSYSDIQRYRHKSACRFRVLLRDGRDSGMFMIWVFNGFSYKACLTYNLTVTLRFVLRWALTFLNQ